MKSLKVPKLSTNVEEVTITRWMKKVGDAVAKGEALAELTTDKAAFEFESPCSGILRKILAEKKSVVPTGYVICLVGKPEDPMPNVEAQNTRLLATHRAQPAQKTAAQPAQLRTTQSTPVRATPAARRLARETGSDLAAVAAANKVEIVTEEMVKAFVGKDKQ